MKGFSPRHRPSSLEGRISMQSTLSFGWKVGKPRFSLVFPNPVGLAAGFDKDGQAIQALMDMGFGSVEIGTVTPLPQPGNAKPRMFRLADDLGIINRYGFNSQGADKVEKNVKAFRQQQQEQDIPKEESLLQSILSFVTTPTKPAQGLLGINIGKNKTTEDAKSDYVRNIRQLGSLADYIVINISSPNTPNLRDLQKAEALSELVQACLDARDELTKPVPILVKLAPDLSYDDLKSMVPTLKKVDGVVVTNTTNQRPDDLISARHQDEIGGLSGAPLKDRSTEMIRKLYALMNGDVFIIGVGGIGSGADAYEKLKAGANVLQIYSMMVFNGPGCVSKIRNDLADLMDQNGQKSLQDVIGRDHEEIFWRKRQESVKASSQEETIMIDQ